MKMSRPVGLVEVVAGLERAATREAGSGVEDVEVEREEGARDR